MAELLIDYGADIDAPMNPREGLTILMQFCGLPLDLSPFQSEICLEVIEFLLERGADKNKKSKKGDTAWTMTKKSQKMKKIEILLRDVKQKYFHTNTKMTMLTTATGEPKQKEIVETEVKLECKCIKCGCLSW